MIKPSAFVLLLIVPLVTFAQDQSKYQCSYGDLQRRVEIVYETGVAVPCEVHYYKDTEAPGERQVLWSATNQSGFCESKTREFISRLEESGWDCGAAAEVAPEPEPEVEVEVEPEVDDTEALAPAETEQPR